MTLKIWSLEGQLSRLDSNFHELWYSTNDMFIHKTRIYIYSQIYYGNLEKKKKKGGFWL